MPVRYRKRILVTLGIVLVAAVVLAVNFTDACRLEAVTLNGTSIDDWHRQFDMLSGRSLTRQPLDSLARLLLADKETHRVDINVVWPHTLAISTNAFNPICFILDNRTGSLCGLCRDGRVVPLENALTDWERPVITGVTVRGYNRLVADVRIPTVAAQLQQLHRDNAGLFRLIEEINFAAPGHLVVSLSGLPVRFKARAEQLRNGLDQFIDFMTHYSPDLSGIDEIDVRFDNMIICSEGTR